VSNVLLEAREKARWTELMTLPAPLTKKEFILFKHFVEMFTPLCQLTDDIQGERVLAPILIPTLLETYRSKLLILMIIFLWELYLYLLLMLMILI